MNKEGTNLNDVACCPNGYKLVVGDNHINLDKTKPEKLPYQCSVGAGRQYTGGGYEVYHADDGWVLKETTGSNWTQYKKNGGGEECCPRDGTMIMFQSDPCDLTFENRDCSWPAGVTAQIECA